MNDEETTPEALAEPETKLVLVVDDDETTISLLRAALEGQGFQIDWAVSGNEALLRVAKKLPDLIITDLMMPGIGGFEFVKKLQSGAAPATPIIVASARQMDPSTEAIIREEANVIEFMRKPIKLYQLYALVHRILKTQPGSHRAPVKGALMDHWGGVI